MGPGALGGAAAIQRTHFQSDEGNSLLCKAVFRPTPPIWVTLFLAYAQCCASNPFWGKKHEESSGRSMVCSWQMQ